MRPKRLSDSFVRTVKRPGRYGGYGGHGAVRNSGCEDGGVRSEPNPVPPGLQFHRVNRTRDKNFWSVRVSQSMRIIVHKTAVKQIRRQADRLLPP